MSNRCANGCHSRPDADGNRHPVPTEPPSLLCRGCEDRLLSWLEKIPEHYALLPEFIEHGSVERNPESKSTKASVAAAPMRLDVIDLLDTRRGRKWHGTEVADGRRGVLGTLESWARLVREEKNITDAQTCTVAYEAATLRRHMLWIAEQPWVDELHADIKALHRDLSDAVGDYRPRPVGRCDSPTEDGSCGGPLMPSRFGGVHCARCGEITPVDRLRFLGARLQDPEAM